MSILKKQKLYEDIYLLQIKAPEIAKKALPGHFVLLQMDENSPRIPIPIADADKTSITLIFKARGKTTEALTDSPAEAISSRSLYETLSFSSLILSLNARVAILSR